MFLCMYVCMYVHMLVCVSFAMLGYVLIQTYIYTCQYCKLPCNRYAIHMFITNKVHQLKYPYNNNQQNALFTCNLFQ